MQHAPPKKTVGHASPVGGSAITAGAEIRVVAPVGGRAGWGGVDADTAPGGLMHSGVLGGDAGARAWLADYLGGTLNRDDRTLMILYYFEGLNVREIAAVLNNTEVSIAGRLHELNGGLQASFRAFRREQAADA